MLRVFKFFAITTVLLVVAGCGSTSNYAGCIVENMEGVQNKKAAAAVRRLCGEKYPKRYDGLEVGVGNGWFGGTTRDECVATKGKTVLDESGSRNVFRACRCLYDEPDYDGQEC
ncbi:hypothetical protein LP109_05525 [Moraxella bovis]|uniref:hypothetical protein n=1 Tax=Moraxella bovis TaxID=476 RepID=UPI0009930728|nr:hypothetical protein [Moraxella bovis]OOR87005.1 hypothetical protein B0182_13445 [Moraxella bovis]UZA17742.1 hypothetical protein LP109_05525 [Moraxella bovis]